MITSEAKKAGAKASSLPDQHLVRECLRGNEEAWSALIDRYKKLIFSIPIKYGLSRDDAADIFQAVCLDMLSELEKLRELRALPKWLMQVTAHKCFRWKKLQSRMVSRDAEDHGPPRGEIPAEAEEALREAQREQILPQAMAELPQRCRRMIEMLFFEDPVRPYREVAASLGIATGSVGFIRQRCLERLRGRLDEMGF
jgi:RNA polymerase sigma factor (sigma-70 family)